MLYESPSRAASAAKPCGPLVLAAVLVATVLFCATAFAQNDTAPALPTPDAEETTAEPVGETAPAGAKTDPVIPTNLLSMLLAGGYLMIPIVIASVISLTFGVERLLVLRRGRIIPHAFTTRFIEHLENDAFDSNLALKLCEENNSPMAIVFAHGIRKWGKPSVEIEQAIIDGGERQVSHLRKHLRVINGVATVAPLLGLLGTVVGMITAFNDMAGGSSLGKSEQLAGGIGVALLTTAAGLTVAIPSLIVYMYLAGRVDLLVMEMDELAQHVVQLISVEGLAEREADDAPRPSVRKKPATRTAS